VRRRTFTTGWYGIRASGPQKDVTTRLTRTSGQPHACGSAMGSAGARGARPCRAIRYIAAPAMRHTSSVPTLKMPVRAYDTMM